MKTDMKNRDVIIGNGIIFSIKNTLPKTANVITSNNYFQKFNKLSEVIHNSENVVDLLKISKSMTMCKVLKSYENSISDHSSKASQEC